MVIWLSPMPCAEPTKTIHPDNKAQYQQKYRHLKFVWPENKLMPDPERFLGQCYIFFQHDQLYLYCKQQRKTCWHPCAPSRSDGLDYPFQFPDRQHSAANDRISYPNPVCVLIPGLCPGLFLAKGSPHFGVVNQFCLLVQKNPEDPLQLPIPLFQKCPDRVHGCPGCQAYRKMIDTCRN